MHSTSITASTLNLWLKMGNLLLVISVVISCQDKHAAAEDVVFTQCQCTCPKAIISLTGQQVFAEPQLRRDNEAQTDISMVQDEAQKSKPAEFDNTDDEDDDNELPSFGGSGIEDDGSETFEETYRSFVDPEQDWKAFHIPHPTSPEMVQMSSNPDAMTKSQQTTTTSSEPAELITTYQIQTTEKEAIYLPELGQKGEKGDIGPPGQAGLDGGQGDRGDPGARGYPGHPGVKGEKGDKGDQGPRGYPGSMGPQGYRGAIGPQGESGPPGPRGVEGPRGYRGETGVAGPKGSPGMPGERGEPGIPGLPGKDSISDNIKRVAFLARLQEHLGPSTATSHILFPQVDFNLGNGYDPSSGSFLVITDGLYVFHLQAMAMADHIAWLAIQVNGEPVAYVWASGYLSGVEQMGVTLTIQQLKVGDVVNILQKSSEKPPNYLYAHYTSFSGYLLG